MKKTYIEPAIMILDVQIESVMNETSSVGVGDNWTSGDAASRGSSWDDED